MAQIIQVVGYKNSGKTTLCEYLVSYFSKRQVRVAVIKHDGHEFQMDQEGTDTWRMTRAGSAAIAITSAQRTAVVEERESHLQELIDRFNEYDLIIVEGFKREKFPKIIMLRGTEDAELLEHSVNVKAAVYWKQAEMPEHSHPKLAHEVIHRASDQGPPESINVLDNEWMSFHLQEQEKIARWLTSVLGLG